MILWNLHVLMGSLLGSRTNGSPGKGFSLKVVASLILEHLAVTNFPS